MNKRGFQIFVFCGIIIIILGIVFTIIDQSTLMGVDARTSKADYYLFKGWHIMIMGVLMLLLGYWLKRSAKKEVENNER